MRVKAARKTLMKSTPGVGGPERKIHQVIINFFKEINPTVKNFLYLNFKIHECDIKYV